MKEAIKIQLEMPLDRVMELDNLMDLAGLNSRKDLLNYALTLFEWAMHENRNGRIIASIDTKDDSYKELVMPVFTTTC